MYMLVKISQRPRFGVPPYLAPPAIPVLWSIKSTVARPCFQFLLLAHARSAPLIFATSSAVEGKKLRWFIAGSGLVRYPVFQPPIVCFRIIVLRSGVCRQANTCFAFGAPAPPTLSFLSSRVSCNFQVIHSHEQLAHLHCSLSSLLSVP